MEYDNIERIKLDNKKKLYLLRDTLNIIKIKKILSFDSHTIITTYK